MNHLTRIVFHYNESVTKAELRKARRDFIITLTLNCIIHRILYLHFTLKTLTSGRAFTFPGPHCFTQSECFVYDHYFFRHFSYVQSQNFDNNLLIPST